MKNYEMRAFAYWFAFLLLLLAMTSCRTKQVDSSKSKVDEQRALLELIKKDNLSRLAKEQELKEKQTKELLQVLSNLNISYEGKSIDDKLDVLLKRTPEGDVKASFSGVGNANFKQDEKYDFSSFEYSLYERQDSLHQVMMDELHKVSESIKASYFEKNKEVEVKGFQFGGWLTFGFIVLFLVLLWWLNRKFKVFS